MVEVGYNIRDRVVHNLDFKTYNNDLQRFVGRKTMGVVHPVMWDRIITPVLDETREARELW